MSTKHSTKPQKNIPSSKHLMEPSLKLTPYSVTKQNSTDTKKIGIAPYIRLDSHGLKLKFHNNTK